MLLKVLIKYDKLVQGICQFDFSLQLIVATIRLVKKLECHMLFDVSLPYCMFWPIVLCLTGLQGTTVPLGLLIYLLLRVEHSSSVWAPSTRGSDEL